MEGHAFVDSEGDEYMTILNGTLDSATSYPDGDSMWPVYDIYEAAHHKQGCSAYGSASNLDDLKDANNEWTVFDDIYVNYYGNVRES
jgi:hypothetical protein